ncbi:MAG: hypothetical protein EGP96_01250 [Roseburia inulinivorans]|nr:hypothetical protein [Roseburia inulinivorans]
MWRQKNSTVFAVLLIAITLNFIVTPTYAKNTELEGENYAPSSSSFQKPANVHTKNDTVTVGYFLGGGIQNSFNKESYPAFSGDQPLYTPYRSGFRFLGWYSDAALHKQIKTIPTDRKDHYILYAKWTAKINNYYNVEYYNYHKRESRFDKNLVLLKDLDYSFYNEIDIPGMPDTREEDVLKKYIFSASQCPQGICLTDEFVLITSYSTEDDCMGELMVFDRETGDYLVTLGMKKDSHLGGVAFDGENLWVCHSNSNTLERISYEYIRLIAEDAPGYCIDASAISDEYYLRNTPSCITCYGGRIWVATYNKMFRSKMYAYTYDTQLDKLVALSNYNIPCKVQGIAFDSQGAVYLSTSLGRSNSSYLKVYSSLIALNQSPSTPSVKVEMPPCSEEIAIVDNNLYVLFESASSKYFEGTDGKGTSVAPIDKVLKVNVATIW